MNAAISYETQIPLVIAEIEFDELRHGCVHIKPKASGVCHSNWHVIKGGWRPFEMLHILGHKGAGEAAHSVLTFD